MTHWHRVALADCPDQSWANGAGVTRQLLVWPVDDAWSLRVSVATISQSGPYSRLEQTQRWHTVVQGALALSINGYKTHLDRESEPFAFDGEQPCDCELLQGPALALNIMTRGPLIAKVIRIRNSPSRSIDASNQTQAFDLDRKSYALAGVYAVAPARVRQGDHVTDLEPAQWIWSDTLESSPLTTRICSDHAVVVLIERTSK